MLKKNKFKIISIITTLFVITTLISFKDLKVKATVSDKPDFDIKFSVSETAVLGEDIVVKGQIIPKPFEIPVPEKEVVFVVDVDPLNNGKLSSLISKIKTFISKITNNENIKIAIIAYDKDAEIKRANNIALLDSEKASEIINKLNKEKNTKTNTGEALRKALYLLNSEESKVDANKTIILISDSIPTASTLYSKGSGLEGNFYTNINKENYENATTDNVSDYNRDLEYAKIMGELINKKGYNVFTIGYGLDKNNEGYQPLREIHQAMSGNDMTNNDNDEKNGFFIAGDNKDIVEKMFSDIADKVLQNYSLNNIDMNINFTGDFSLNIGGNTVNLSNINYKLVYTSNGKVEYEADPIPFEFTIKANTVGYQQIFDKVTITYPWKDSIEKIDIAKDLFITVQSNELPNISAKFISEDKLEVKKDEEIPVEYKIIPEDFTSSLLSTESGKIDEAIFITDLTQTMKNNNRFSIFQNWLTNKVLDDHQLNLTKFGLIGYSDSVLVGDRNDINNPKDISMKLSNSAGNLLKPLFDISDGNSKDGFRQFFQNGYLYNSITNCDTRDINEALRMAKDIFDKFGIKGKRKAIILINSGSVNYSKDIAQEIKQEGYKIISLDLSGTTNTNLKNLHVDLGGRIGEAEKDNDFLISKSDGGEFNFGYTDMDNVAKRLIDGTMSSSYSSITSKIYFDLNNNFEYVDKSNSDNISLVNYDGNKLCFQISDIHYVYSGNMIDGKYEYIASTQTISFKVKVKSDKAGILTFAENPTLSDKNNYKNYLLYNKFNDKESKKFIYTPSFTAKNEIKIISHGLYNGINNGQVDIQENNNDETFKIVQGSKVTFGTNFTFSGSSAQFELNIDNNFYSLNKNEAKNYIKIYKVSKDSSENISLEEVENKNISGTNNEFDISINDIKKENYEAIIEILVVYQCRIKEDVASKQPLTNQIKFSDEVFKDATVITPEQSNDEPSLPDLF